MNTYNLQFKKLCSLLHLGEIIHPPEPVPGGFLHRMYAVETTRGKYAIKALNPQIMRRPMVVENILNTERIARIAANIVSAIPAKMLEGHIVHEVEKQFYIVFDWVEGESLRLNKIQTTHCKKIGAILADIHAIDFPKMDINNSTDIIHMIDWNFYMQKGFESDAGWSAYLAEHIDTLYTWTDRAIKAARRLSSDMIISHRDLDPKNVLWRDETPYMIDWESAGYINPMHELMETSIYWSINEEGNVDKDKLLAFVQAYNTEGLTHKDWRTALENGFLSKMEWLEYNIKRSLWIECSDEKEQQMGTSQVMDTIDVITQYANIIPVLERWLKEEFNTECL